MTGSFPTFVRDLEINVALVLCAALAACWFAIARIAS